MSNSEVKFIYKGPIFKGYNQLRKSNEIRDLIKKEADKIKSRCGNGYETDVKYVSRKVMSSVYTATTEAMKDNLENNTLLKASKA